MAEGLAKGAREQCIIIAKEMLKDGMKPEKVAGGYFCILCFSI